MQTQNPRLSEYSKNPLILDNMQHPMMHEMDTMTDVQSQSEYMDQTDPRWQFAARVQMTLGKHRRVQAIGQYESLVEAGDRAGFSGMHARAMIGIVEDAQCRGGMDHQVFEELTGIPVPAANESLPERLRWMTFGVLFLWAFVIAGMMQFV